MAGPAIFTLCAWGLEWEGKSGKNYSSAQKCTLKAFIPWGQFLLQDLINAIIPSACGKGRKGWTPTFTEQPTAMHRCISFNRRQTIPWLQLCRNRAPRGQEMESGCIPRPTRHQDPWAPKLPVSPSPMLKHYPGLEGTLPFTCCFPYISPHIISQPCRIAKNSFSTIINSCLVSKINSNLCEPAVT